MRVKYAVHSIKKEFIPPVIAPDIIETLGDDYEIWTYEDYERLPTTSGGSLSVFGYSKCLAPLSTQGLVKERCVQASKGVCSGTIRKWCVCGGY